VRLLARSVAALALERGLADAAYYRLALPSPLARDVLRWRDYADRRLTAAIRTLASVRHIEMCDVRRTVEALRLVG
jgi:hypothetical protein